MYTEFDLQTWNRIDTYQYFSGFELPFFNICHNIDITAVYQKCKINSYSVNLALHYCSLMALNVITEFRLRILDNRVVLFDEIHGGGILLMPDNSIRFCLYEYEADFSVFMQKAIANTQKVFAENKTDERTQSLDMIHFSVVPWLSFTSISHPRKLNQHESIPKITFGKFFKDNDRLLMPLSVEVNHCLMDGYHVGRFVELLSQQISAF